MSRLKYTSLRIAWVIENTRVSTSVQKGEFLRQLGQNEEALQVLDQAIQRDPEYQFAYKDKAKVLVNLRRYDDALAAYDRVIELEPSTFYSYSSKIDLLAQMNRDEDALAVYDQFIDRNPHLFEGYRQKLFFLSRRRRYVDGLTTCDRYRAKMLDDCTVAFLTEHPDATVLDLGCGLDSRRERVNPPKDIRWFDIDYSDVIEVRRHFYHEDDGYQMIGCSLTDPEFLDAIPTDRPAIIVASMRWRTKGMDAAATV